MFLLIKKPEKLIIFFVWPNSANQPQTLTDWGASCHRSVHYYFAVLAKPGASRGIKARVLSATGATNHVEVQTAKNPYYQERGRFNMRTVS